MPVRVPPQTPGAPPPRRGVTLPAELQDSQDVPDSGTFEPGLGTGLLGGAAALGAGLIARKPRAAWEGAKTIGRGLGAARQQLMLSGLAPLKSVLGNIGATGVEAAERGTMKPLKELFSMETVRDIGSAYKTNVPYPGTTTLPGPTPGRVMGALDQATRNAMQRAGLTAGEAERAVFQTPLTGPLGDALDSPIARHMVPFRRTPFNQLIEGFKTLKPENWAAHPLLTGGSGVAGGVHGAATSEDRFPVSVGLGAAGAAKYGVPYSLGAIIGRQLAGGEGGGGLASSAVPISEYGIESGLINPLQPFSDPAALRAFRRLSGE